MATACRDLIDTSRAALHAQFRRDVLTGLGQQRKAIPARWFYDRRGSELFEEITRLPEYYPTRTEAGILMAHATRIGRMVGAQHHVVVEFGAGSAAKTPLLLDAIWTAAYVPIDISGEFLGASCAALAARYPELPIYPVEADFCEPAVLPAELTAHPRLGFFPGSTIGNLEPVAAVDLLRSMKGTLGAGSLLLIGFDRIKGEAELLRAYDDAQGTTAAFNLNLAVRINRELSGTIPLDALAHRAVWNEERARVEMHIEALRDMAFTVCGQDFTLAAGETIHTENCHKYDPRSASLLLRAGGWDAIRSFGDPADRFMVVLARATGSEQTA